MPFFCTGREGATWSITCCSIGILTRALRKTFSDTSTIIGADTLFYTSKEMIAMAEILVADLSIIRKYF